MRDGLLNGEIFDPLTEARTPIESWRRQYNTVRPHHSLGYRPPAPKTATPPRLPPARARDDARRLGATDGFYRLFQVPGMAHCQGGALPAAFGQSLEAPSASDDPAHDIRRALEAWVERGERPMALLATAGPAGAQRLTRLVPTRFGERGGMTRHRPRAKRPITSR